MDGLRRAAAGGEPLGVQRARSRRAWRTRRAAAGGAAGPRRRTRARPRSSARRSRSCAGHQAGASAPARRRAGVHEQRRVARLEAVEQGVRPRRRTSATAGSVSPRAPASSSASTSSGVSAAPHSSNGPPSSRMPSLNASSRGRPPSAGSASIPSAVESETTMRSMPSRAASAARASGSWSAACSALGGSPASSRRSSRPSRTSRGAAERRASASISALGEQVLVEVGGHRSGHIRTKPTELVGKDRGCCSPRPDAVYFRTSATDVPLVSGGLTSLPRKSLAQ